MAQNVQIWKDGFGSSAGRCWTYNLRSQNQRGLWRMLIPWEIICPMYESVRCSAAVVGKREGLIHDGKGSYSGAPMILRQISAESELIYDLITELWRAFEGDWSIRFTSRWTTSNTFENMRAHSWTTWATAAWVGIESLMLVGIGIYVYWR